MRVNSSLGEHVTMAVVWAENSRVRYKDGSVRAAWDQRQQGKWEGGQGLDKASRGPRGPNRAVWAWLAPRGTEEPWRVPERA